MSKHKEIISYFNDGYKVLEIITEIVNFAHKMSLGMKLISDVKLLMKIVRTMSNHIILFVLFKLMLNWGLMFVKGVDSA